jgi:hypothetical protein
MPESEHESAVAAWLDHADTRREMDIIKDRFPNWNEYQVTTMALMMELVVALNIYGTPTLVETTADPDELLEILEDDEDEEWKK